MIRYSPCETGWSSRILVMLTIGERISSAGRIEISAVRVQGTLEVKVRDDGPGLIPSQGHNRGIGLTNTRARLLRLKSRCRPTLRCQVLRSMGNLPPNRMTTGVNAAQTYMPVIQVAKSRDQSVGSCERDFWTRA